MSRTLLCITSCQRLGAVKALLVDWARAALQRDGVDLLLAVDGDDPGYRAFADAAGVPLLWGPARAGVGVTKNRVVAALPDYEHYVFVEDDVELLDPSVLDAHLTVAAAGGIHHLSLHPPERLRGSPYQTRVGGYVLAHADYGSAQVSYYSGEVFRRVGGFHPAFSALRRYGHTEHSWRIWRAGLAPAPFNLITAHVGSCFWHDPGHVTRARHDYDRHGIVALERRLIAERHAFVALAPLGRPRLNGATLTAETVARLERVAAEARPGFARAVIAAHQARERAAQAEVAALARSRAYRLGEALLGPLRRLRDLAHARPVVDHGRQDQEDPHGHP